MILNSDNRGLDNAGSTVVISGTSLCIYYQACYPGPSEWKGERVL